MNPRLGEFLNRAEAIMNHQPEEVPVRGEQEVSTVRVGVDLGTGYTVLTVLDQQQQPLAGKYRFAQVVRDGLVVDFRGAIDLPGFSQWFAR